MLCKYSFIESNTVVKFEDFIFDVGFVLWTTKYTASQKFVLMAADFNFQLITEIIIDLSTLSHWRAWWSRVETQRKQELRIFRTRFSGVIISKIVFIMPKRR